MTKLQQDLHNCHALFCQMQDASRTHAGGKRLEHMQDVSGMRAGHVWDACKHYLGTELYLITMWLSASPMVLYLPYCPWGNSQSCHGVLCCGQLPHLQLIVTDGHYSR